MTSTTRARPATGPAIVGVALIGALAADVVLSLLTSLIAYWGPHGHSYFLGGNSALQFSSALAPAILGAGWTMLALHARSYGRFWLAGLAVGILGAVLLTLYWSVAILTGIDLGLALIFGVLWSLAAPILALTLPIKGATPSPGRADVNPAWYVVAAVTWLVVIAAPTVGLQACGPALGLPEGARSFTVCVPFKS